MHKQHFYVVGSLKAKVTTSAAPASAATQARKQQQQQQQQHKQQIIHFATNNIQSKLIKYTQHNGIILRDNKRNYAAR